MKLRKILRKAMSLTMALTFVVTSVSFPSFVNPANVKAETAKAPGNIPGNAQIFFDANGENQSFNIEHYWDVYNQVLNGNATNIANKLVLTSSTDGGIISGNSEGTGAGDGEVADSGNHTQTYTVSVPSNNGYASGKSIGGVNIPKGAKVTLTGPEGNFVFGTLSIGTKTYNLSATSKGIDFDVDGTVNYQGTAEPWASPTNTGGINGFIGGAAITLKDTPVVQNGNVTIELENAYADVDFNLTVSWTGDAVYEGAASSDGILKIDYETGQQKTWYAAHNGTGIQDFGSHYYSDGTYTIVGWGGSLSNSRYKYQLNIKMKSGRADVNTADIANYMNICLYDKDGNCLQVISPSQLSAAYVSTDAQGYSLYQIRIDEDHDGISPQQYTQGIKLYFNGTAEKHRGTLLVKDVTVNSSFEGEVSEDDFSPFTYDINEKFNGFMDDQAIDNPLPFLRLAQYAGTPWSDLGLDGRYDREGGNTGTVAGYNVSLEQKWHLWTMSTSDANIVKGNVNNDSVRDALQIKYSNGGTVNAQSRGNHTTYTNLDGQVAKTGEWLVMTLRAADFDPNIKLVLKNKGEIVKTTPIVSAGGTDSDCFVDSTKNNAEVITADTIRSEYQTVYYHLNGNGEDISFDSVSFDFSDVEDIDAVSRYMYVTEIYLLNPDVQISKKVKVNDGTFTADYTSANEEDTLTYQMTIKNNGAYAAENIEVRDTVPAGVTYVSGGTYTASDNTVSWTIPSLEAGAETTVEFAAKVNSQNNGLIRNTAKITSVNGEKVNTNSNTVTTTVQKETPEKFVYFAEVGQKTSLPMALGTTSGTTTETTKTSKDYTVTVPFTSNGSASSGSIQNVSIPEGATVTLKGPTNGGFVMTDVTLNNKTFYTDRDHQGADNGYTQNGRLNYHCKNNQPENGAYDGENLNGKISGFLNEDSSITLNNVPAGENTSLQINLEQIYNENKTFTLTVSYDEVHEIPGEATPDTFKVIPQSTDAGAAIDENGIVGKNSGEIVYTSTKTGTDEFYVKINKGGAEKNVSVTVYSYRTANHIYVLDYGLPVDLAKDEDSSNNDNFLLKDAVLDLNIEGISTGYAFSGIADKKRNINGIADAEDYATPYGIATGEKLSKDNGEVTYTYNKADNDTLSVIYTPKKFMDSVDTFYYGVQVSREGVTSEFDSTNATPVMEGRVDVMPANIVYYEDNFSNSGKDNTDPTSGIIYDGNNVVSNDKEFDAKQSNSITLQYGHDQAYTNSLSNFSGNGATTLGDMDVAAFEFKGTGFDIVSRTSDLTGVLMVNVMEKTKDGVTAVIKKDNLGLYVENGYKNLVKAMMVDTYYVDGDLYQIPVISWKSDDNEAKEYIVTITSWARGNADKKVYIDGIRIYNPITAGSSTNTGVGDDNGTVTDQYAAIGEDKAQIREIRELIFGKGFEFNYDNPLDSKFDGEPEASLIRFDPDIVDNASGNKGVFLSGSTVVESVDENGNTTEPGSVAEITKDMMAYAVQGPNNELYLGKYNGFGFKATLNDNLNTNTTLQIGIKRVTGKHHDLQYWTKDKSWVRLTYDYGNNTIFSATENYYKIPVDNMPVETVNGKKTYTVIIREMPQEGSIEGDFISLTNLKVNNYTIAPLSEDVFIKTSEDSALIPVNFKNLYGVDAQSSSIAAGTVAAYTFTTSTDVERVKVEIAGKEVRGVRALHSDKDGVRTWTIKFKPASSVSEFNVTTYNSIDNYSTVTVQAKPVNE